MSGVSLSISSSSASPTKPVDSCEQEVTAGQSLGDPPGALFIVPLGGVRHGACLPVSTKARRPAPGGPCHDREMIDHFGINCADMSVAAAFYDKVLGVLGHRRILDYDVAIGYGTDKPDFWIGTFEGIGPNREMHLAFTAPDAATVRAFHAAALERRRGVAARATPVAGVPRRLLRRLRPRPGRQQRRGRLSLRRCLRSRRTSSSTTTTPALRRTP